MHLEAHRDLYRALVARDARFDGRFFVGVSTTGLVTATFADNPVLSNGTSLNFVVGPATTPGSYPLTINATSTVGAAATICTSSALRVAFSGSSSRFTRMVLLSRSSMPPRAKGR